MKNAYLLFVDIFIIFLATAFSVILRDNLEISHDRVVGITPYLISTIISSLIIIPAFKINRLIWRFSSLPDYIRLISAMSAITLSSLIVTFAFNRLDGVPRSLPFLQFNLSITMLIGLRVLYKLRHLARSSRQTRMTPLKIVDRPRGETVLLVGISRLTETYLQSLAEFAEKRIDIAGILAHHPRYAGRLIARHRILGTPEDIGRILSDLNVNGVVIDKIVITAPIASFSAKARAALEMVEHSRSVQVIYLPERLGFEAARERSRSEAEIASPPSNQNSTIFEIQKTDLETMQVKAYWKIKRIIDVFAALSILIILSPIMFFVAVGIFLNMGRPVLFWQQRPGLGGRVFRLYKFRTMKAALAADGRELSDAERLSRVGSFLRRTRIDELPQLFNILRGDMSFIGPRPLLPRDQDEAYRARLLVRPGLTGWAQVVGGRAISGKDKAALDVWYVKHASLILDLKVALKTIPIVLFGETISRNQIEAAWNDLREAGVLRGGISQMDSPRQRAAA